MAEWSAFLSRSHPALGPAISSYFSTRFLKHPLLLLAPSSAPRQKKEFSPSRVFLRPSAPMMTSNSNSDREWSAGRNSARQPISARTGKWDVFAVGGGRTQWSYVPCVGREEWPTPPGIDTRNPRGKNSAVPSHTWIWSPSGFSFSSVQDTVHQQCQLHAWLYWFL